MSLAAFPNGLITKHCAVSKADPGCELRDRGLGNARALCGGLCIARRQKPIVRLLLQSGKYWGPVDALGLVDEVRYRLNS
jgi:hypothetical protein